MKKNTYQYILQDGTQFVPFDTNYELLNYVGIHLVPEHSEKNAYHEFDRWTHYIAGEWITNPAPIVNKEKPYKVFRIRKNKDYLMVLADEIANAKEPTGLSYFGAIEEEARQKGIYLGDDYMKYTEVTDSTLKDDTYTLWHTTWYYTKANNDISDVLTMPLGKVEVKDNEVNLLQALKAVPSMDTRMTYDPHKFFEGFSIEDSKLHIHFGS